MSSILRGRRRAGRRPLTLSLQRHESPKHPVDRHRPPHCARHSGLRRRGSDRAAGRPPAGRDEPLGMARSSFLFDAEIRANYSLGHDGKGHPDKWEIALPLASSTLHTTASDLARFGAHLAS